MTITIESALERSCAAHRVPGVTVDAHGARCGIGSNFRVWMATETAALSASRTSTSDRTPAANQSPARRVLVADDNRDAAASFAMLLELLGHEVLAVHDGQQAVEATQTFAPEFIFMDIGMPILDGFEATRRIRALNLPRQPVVIALTGWDQERDRENARAAGIDHHLVKPIDVEAICSLIAGLPRV